MNVKQILQKLNENWMENSKHNDVIEFVLDFLEEKYGENSRKYYYQIINKINEIINRHSYKIGKTKWNSYINLKEISPLNSDFGLNSEDAGIVLYKYAYNSTPNYYSSIEFFIKWYENDENISNGSHYFAHGIVDGAKENNMTIH
ncbi:MAG: hypothetical protein QXX30_00925 [Candidatus Aenigmatarchaeota archaeon]